MGAQGTESFEILESGQGKFERIGSETIKTLSGGVVLRYKGMQMSCEQVVLSDQDRLARANGTVRLRRADGLRINADRLHWQTSGNNAYFEGEVQVKKGNMSLETPSLRFMGQQNQALYQKGGTLRQGSVRIVSDQGTGYLDDEVYSFEGRVTVAHPELDLKTHRCVYHARQDSLALQAPSRLVSLRGTFHGQAGHYHLKRKELFLHSRTEAAWAVMDSRYFVLADTLQVDQQQRSAKARGQALWTDSVRKISLHARSLQFDSAFRLGLTPMFPQNPLVRQGLHATGRVWLQDHSVQPPMDWMTESMQAWFPSSKDSLVVWTRDSSVCKVQEWLMRSNTLLADQARGFLQAEGRWMAWQGLSQMEAGGLHWSDWRDTLSVLDFQGLTGISEMADSIPLPVYHQASGQKAKAELRNRTLYRMELQGNTVTLTWNRGSDSLWAALNRTEAARAVFDFENQKLARARYYGGPRGTYQPYGKVKDPRSLLEGVRPQPDLKRALEQSLLDRKGSYPDRGLAQLLQGLPAWDF